MDSEELKARTKRFALRVIRVFNALPRTATSRVLGTQLLRAGTSVGANYRATCKARSKAEFIAKIGVVEEEADECCYWLELLGDSGEISSERLQAVLQEAKELTAIAAASRKSAGRGK